MVVQVFQLFLFVSDRRQCPAVLHDFYIHGRIDGKRKLLLLEIEDFRRREIQLPDNGVDGKIGHIRFPVLMFQAEITLAFFDKATGRADKVIVFYQRFFFHLFLWYLVFVILIGDTVPAVKMFHEIGKILCFQASHLKASADFIFQQFLHFQIAVDFIIWHGNKVVHQRVVHFMEKLSECEPCGFFDVLQTECFFRYHELKAEEEAVIHLIVANHGHKGFRLLVYLFQRHLTKPTRYQFFCLFLLASYGAFRRYLQSVYLALTGLCDKLAEAVMDDKFLLGG